MPHSPHVALRRSDVFIMLNSSLNRTVPDASPLAQVADDDVLDVVGGDHDDDDDADGNGWVASHGSVLRSSGGAQVGGQRVSPSIEPNSEREPSPSNDDPERSTSPGEDSQEQVTSPSKSSKEPVTSHSEKRAVSPVKRKKEKEKERKKWQRIKQTTVLDLNLGTTTAMDWYVWREERMEE